MLPVRGRVVISSAEEIMFYFPSVDISKPLQLISLIFSGQSG